MDPKRALLHDFNNLLTELLFAVEAIDSKLVGHYSDELKAMFRLAVERQREA
jgi:hypothetical protein